MSGDRGPGPLPGGVSPPQDGGEWHILGHTYWNRAWSDATFAFETHDPPGTDVPGMREVDRGDTLEASLERLGN